MGSTERLLFIWVLKDAYVYFGILEHPSNIFFTNLDESYQEKAKSFILNYCKNHSSHPEKINVIVDIARNSTPYVFEELVLLYISLNQNVEDFSKVLWRGSGTIGSGDVILADIKAAEWKNILSIVQKSDLGIKLIPIKKFLNDKIESAYKEGDWERKRRFLRRN